MNITTMKTPSGQWQAIDADNDPSCEFPYDTPKQPTGFGDTEQEAIDDLCEELGLNYSYYPLRAVR